jgi:glycosyltransferase involved in cell wall biosynthesis
VYKLSIVTITFDSEEYLEQAILSVIGQTYANIEYIVVDGGSSDGTLDIIRKYEHKIDRWISEPDKGIADAMNKAVTMATGDFVYFLHSDDYLENEEAIEQACEHLTAREDIFLFSIYLEKDGNKVMYRPRGLNAWINFKNGVYHQSVICSRSLFEAIGNFDTSFPLGMDYDFFLRAYRRGIKSRIVDIPIATMRLVGVSSQTDWPSLRERFAEERRLQRKNCPSIAMRVIYAIYWLLYLPFRRLRYLVQGQKTGYSDDR